jgi:hypothetical protein
MARRALAPVEITVRRNRLDALEAVARAAEALRSDPDWLNMLELPEYVTLDKALDRLARAKGKP